MSIPYINFKKQWEDEKEDLLKIISKVLSSGNYVGGDEINYFEESIKKICNVKNVVAMNSGTDALVIGMHMLGVKSGDEVITPPNSFIASTSSIIHLGAKPIFVDVLDDQNINPDKIEKAISHKTKAIMPVHLTGRMCKMEPIIALSKKYNIPIIEDAAQAIGSKYHNKPSGSLSKIGCFSAHPLKNLNAYGDAGYLTTDDDNLANKIRVKINHGLEDRNTVNEFGYLSRMDNLQAAILNYRINKLDKVIDKRRKNALLYKKLLDKKKIFIPNDNPNCFDTYHTFVIQVDKRDHLKDYLLNKGIQTSIHYPVPIHLQPAAKYLGYKLGDFPNTELQSKRILTLPINQYLEDFEIEEISKQINNYY